MELPESLESITVDTNVDNKSNKSQAIQEEFHDLENTDVAVFRVEVLAVSAECLEKVA